MAHAWGIRLLAESTAAWLQSSQRHSREGLTDGAFTEGGAAGRHERPRLNGFAQMASHRNLHAAAYNVALTYSFIKGLSDLHE
jgi:hypothetical protein